MKMSSHGTCLLAVALASVPQFSGAGPEAEGPAPEGNAMTVALPKVWTRLPIAVLMQRKHLQLQHELLLQGAFRQLHITLHMKGQPSIAQAQPACCCTSRPSQSVLTPASTRSQTDAATVCREGASPQHCARPGWRSGGCADDRLQAPGACATNSTPPLSHCSQPPSSCLQITESA